MAVVNRVLHLTLHKSGSQWVRDVLGAPEMLSYSKMPHSGMTCSMKAINNLIIPDNSFSGPIYGMNQSEWDNWRKPGDCAIVVLRDPRDVMISLFYSILYSHGAEPEVSHARRLLYGLAGFEEQLNFMLLYCGDSSVLRMYRTWSNIDSQSALLISYEQLVADQLGAFRKIVDWLGWEVPNEILNAVVERLSFEARSGRQPGSVDKFSHLRKGVANDWRNYFTRDIGQRWEALYPDLLVNAGYEQASDWWHSLPEALPSHDLENSGMKPQDSKNQLINLLEQKLLNAQAELIAKEKVIQELTQVCAERLAVIELLDAEVQPLKQPLANPNRIFTILKKAKLWVQ